ncbi:hypothetical protein Q1695_004751 [Nippostrongylus brasiliensis]|nr:hypothetical protein Q1695_004751 [Nippostrongylus brasiliensis]
MIITFLLPIILVQPCIALFGFLQNPQSVAVNGTLQCEGKPAHHVKVKMVATGLLIDRTLDKGETDSNGRFSLKGKTKAFGSIKPKVIIYHKCRHTGRCYRVQTLIVPKEYIIRSGNDAKIYKPKTIHLDNKVDGEKIKCL